ncbi:hemerythrin domain-containing protein [Streptomyces sp. TRM66268-LWL]|uniref:Hemerythrin domain-containing protein n=1 Tax=Streptomyces polyasparticus TaxID=2767826 RepID=A0ABR7SI05_9ACTN|nr:hemerythrin domain-containing protein [Streptomyces polyasparticus]MBC9715117.1 hemerythrin domain-containing protein [Streptomyces polyasparticus]
MPQGDDVIQELTTDHREVEELFKEIDKFPPHDPERKRLADQLTIELVRHSVAEEQHLYPAVRKHLSGGDALADKEIADHSRVEELLKDLERREADDVRFDAVLARLQAEVSEHVAEEEQHLFVQLATTCEPQTLQVLGDKVRTAKKTAPTRPHPSAPSTPPANKLLAPGAGLVDRVRDYVSGRGK